MFLTNTKPILVSSSPKDIQRLDLFYCGESEEQMNEYYVSYYIIY